MTGSTMDACSEAETRAMERALELAARAGRDTFPNPLVGAVIISAEHGETLGEGYHQCCGGPHAETIALEAAGAAAAGSTLVVTLEPCCHRGRTGPCTRAIIEAGVSRVVIAARDPNPMVDGKGIGELREAGLDVVEGVMEPRAAALNEVYFHHVRTGRSHVHLKMAVSLDGRIAAADGSSRWISGEASRERSHQLRSSVSAVMIGAGTALTDDPRLDVRNAAHRGAAPARIIVGGTRSVPLGMRALSDRSDGARRILAGPANAGWLPETAPEGIEVWPVSGTGPDGCPPGGVDPEALLERTAREGLGSILCEGGARLAASLLRADLVCRVSLFVAPMIIGSEGVPAIGPLGVGTLADAYGLVDVSVKVLGRSDVLVEGRICSPE